MEEKINIQYKKSLRCRIGVHKWRKVINAYEDKQIIVGQVLVCDRCDSITKWGRAYIPQYMKERYKIL